MNIIQAIKEVGHISIVEGFWKNVMVGAGLLGFIVFSALVLIGGFANGVTISLMFFFITINTLGLYIPIKYVYCCRDSKADIDFFFSQPGQNKKGVPEELFSALNHMAKGTTLERHNVSCQKCWDYYMDMKRKHCGG